MTTQSRRLRIPLLTTALAIGVFSIAGQFANAELPVKVGEFFQDVQETYTPAEGLPAEAIAKVAVDAKGNLFAQSVSGDFYNYEADRWKQVDKVEGLFQTLPWYDSLKPLVDSPDNVRGLAEREGEIAVAVKNGLYLGDGKKWNLALPQQGDIRWAPVDVRAVTFDEAGQLWFAAPQGVGRRTTEGEWTLFTGADGLPYNDFTCIAAGPKGVWFGTTNGAIRFQNGQWHFRQGRRWLLENHVNDIAVDADGNAWIATAAGISCIRRIPMTLEKKADYYSAEIEKYNRRTHFGYVNPARLSTPGDKSTAKPTYSDNDGFNTGLYISAVSFGYAATKDPQLKEYADKAFRALSFLSEVTQGGPHPAPKGFIARNVIPVTEPNPNERYDHEYDVRRNQRDSLWKIIQPRLPLDKTGQWYWKCDSSSDELDGHFFGYAIYYDHVCESQPQKKEVRRVVRDIIEHIIKHDYSLVDHDGKPTRWAHFSPDDMNRNPAWKVERGLNCYSILTYLTIAHHITGDPKYREIYRKLAIDHGYAMNGMSQFKWIPGPHLPGHQPDDNMAFMNYYHLLRYETDPKLLNMYQFAIHRHWMYEKLERNAFTNFIYAACCLGKKRRDNWGEIDLTPPPDCFEDAVDTLKRYPLDLVQWPMSNAHRIDKLPLGDPGSGHDDIGSRVDGYAFPIDERHEIYWDWDLWKLSANYQGKVLRPGHHYLLAYYMGLYHGFFEN